VKNIHLASSTLQKSTLRFLESKARFKALWRFARSCPTRDARRHRAGQARPPLSL